jgi:hypothetical protein
VPFNNFDALLADLQAVQRLRDTGTLRKALAQADEERIAKSFPSVAELRKQRQRPAATRERVMLQELVPSQPKPRTPRAPTRAQMRAWFAAGREHILTKAMSLLAAGEITATQVAAVEAKLNRIVAGL